MGKTLVTVTITILGCFVILIAGYALKLHKKFLFKYEIDVVSAIIGLLTLIITALIAYWVSNVIERDRAINQNERLIILARVDDFSKHVDGILEIISSPNIQLIRVTSAIKQCGLFNTGILFLISESKTIPTTTFYQSQIFNNLTFLNGLMTDYPSNPPLPAGQIEPVRVQAGNYMYTPIRAIEIEQVLSEIKDDLSRYSLYIIQS